MTFGLVVAAVVMLLEREPARGRSAAPERTPPVSRRAPSPSSTPDAAPDCPPVGAACHDGDVWLMDACGGAGLECLPCDGGCDDGDA
ncbi:MAG: hypothetical protein KC486_26235, partial [Myxococcales bacterium]|nr:hypothetical protein [Myxococcales bacterium]